MRARAAAGGPRCLVLRLGPLFKEFEGLVMRQLVATKKFTLLGEWAQGRQGGEWAQGRQGLAQGARAWVHGGQRRCLLGLGCGCLVLVVKRFSYHPLERHLTARTKHPQPKDQVGAWL
jgi:hypothetical protein